MRGEFKVKIVENKVEHSYLITIPNGSVLAKFRTDITSATDIGLDSELISQTGAVGGVGEAGRV